MSTIPEEKNFAALEALLFYYGEPLALRQIAKLLKMQEEACAALLDAFSEKIAKDETSGLVLLKNGSSYQLGTKPEFRRFGEALAQDEFRETLTPAAVETLSIIGYLGPVTRATIDYIRGVNSSFILRNLLMRGLVDRKFHEHKKNIYEYSVSFDFLRHMGLQEPGALPEYARYHTILEEFGVGAEREGAPAPETQELPLEHSPEQ